MATEDQYLAGRHGLGSQPEVLIAKTLTVSGNSTVEQTITIPAGSVLKSIDFNTPTAISGTPTHAYASVGLTTAGGEIVAATDAKAQGNISGTIVVSIDKIQQFVSDTVLFLDLVTSGGTASAGPVNFIVSYGAPVK